MTYFEDKEIIKNKSYSDEIEKILDLVFKHELNNYNIEILDKKFKKLSAYLNINQPIHP